VQEGDVLVARAVDPAWTMVFGKVAGLVMEVGGQLSHGAVVAREYGIPAVSGVQGITSMVRDGEVIVVDGYSGRIIPSAR
ncbi:MAG TPA: PEP-utilizing enzyme, partial [Chloroflexi bacterium]|nr:PEP-utilizing enzyme [Chloroflexota bacterium]